jgi:thioredoxin 1
MAFKMIKQDDYNKEVVTSTKPVVMVFSAPWCGYCKRLKPALMQLAGEVDAKVNFAGVNIDEEKELAAKYAIETIPTLILRSNGKDSEQFVNPPSKAEIKKWLQEKGVL